MVSRSLNDIYYVSKYNFEFSTLKHGLNVLYIFCSCAEKKLLKKFSDFCKKYFNPFLFQAEFHIHVKYELLLNYIFVTTQMIHTIAKVYFLSRFFFEELSENIIYCCLIVFIKKFQHLCNYNMVFKVCLECAGRNKTITRQLKPTTCCFQIDRHSL